MDDKDSLREELIERALNAVEIGPDDPLAFEHLAIRNLLSERFEDFDLKFVFSNRFPSVDYLKSCKAEPEEKQVAHVKALLQWAVVLDGRVAEMRRSAGGDVHNMHLVKGWGLVWFPRCVVSKALAVLLRKRLPLDAETVEGLLSWCVASAPITKTHFPVDGIIRALEEPGMKEDALCCADLLGKFATLLRERSWDDKSLIRYADRVDAVAGVAGDIPVDSGEAWSDDAISFVNRLPEKHRGNWVRLLSHCRSAAGGSPSQSWLDEARSLVGAIDAGQTADALDRWFRLTAMRRTVPALSKGAWRSRCAEREFGKREMGLRELLVSEAPAWREMIEIRREMMSSDDAWNYLQTFAGQPGVVARTWTAPPVLDVPENPPPYDPVEDHLLSETNMDVLRGLAWVGGTMESKRLARALGFLASSAYRKIAGKGPRAVRVGNAAVTALGMMPGKEALIQLALLSGKEKFGTAKQMISKAFAAAAERDGLRVDEIEEMSVPDYGMDADGRRTGSLGGFVYQVSIGPDLRVDVSWTTEDGKPRKTIPAAVKRDCSEQWGEVVAEKKELERMLTVQKGRMEAMYLTRNSWPLEIWMERYLDHPVVGCVTRGLIWRFSAADREVSAVWSGGKLVDAAGVPVALHPEMIVSLWHPLHEGQEDRETWRSALERLGIPQPFKQVDREVYEFLGSPEVDAAGSLKEGKVLRQHAFNSLCSTRGWRHQLPGPPHFGT